MPIFIKADDDVVRLIDHTMDKYHQRLRDVDVTVQAVMAIAKVDENGDPVGPALKHHGYPCLAKIRVVPHKDRVQGMADAEIVIDGDRWTLLSMDERIAILDHELTHLEPVLDEETPRRGEDGEILKDADGRVRFEVKTDDGGRPKLKMRLHDHEFGWFTEIAERHGKASQEMQQARALIDESGQVYFAWLDAPAPTEERPIPATDRAAIGRFVKNVSKAMGPGASMTIEAGGHSVTIPGGAR